MSSQSEPVVETESIERAPYSSPVLTEFGTIHDLTQGETGTEDDPGGGTSYGSL